MGLWDAIANGGRGLLSFFRDDDEREGTAGNAGWNGANGGIGQAGNAGGGGSGGGAAGAGGLFGGGALQAADPVDQRLSAWQQLRQEGLLPTLALTAGLSMLANNRGQGLGQSIGQGFGDAMGALTAYRQVQKQDAEKAAEIARQEAAAKLAQENWQKNYDLDVKRQNFAEQNQLWDRAFRERQFRASQANAAAGRAAAERNAALAAAEAEAKARRGELKEVNGQLGQVFYDDQGRASFVPVQGVPEGAADGKNLIYDASRGGFVDKATGKFTKALDEQGNPLRATNDVPEEFLKADAAAIKDLSNISKNMNVINGLIEMAGNSSPGSTGNRVWLKSLVPFAGQKWIDSGDPQGVGLRSAIMNFQSQVMNDISGAAVSESEKARLLTFLPDIGDSNDVLIEKLHELRNFYRQQADLWGMTYGQNQTLDKVQEMAETGMTAGDLAKRNANGGKAPSKREPLDSFWK